MFRHHLASVAPSDQDDILLSQHDGQVIHGLGGNDDITARHNRLKLFGDGGNDTIHASGGVVGSLYGGDGDDLIYGSALVPCRIEGGKGADHIEVDSNPLLPIAATLSFSGSTNAVRVYLDARATGYGTAGDAKDDTYAGLFARVLGSAGDDWITDTSINGDVAGVQSQKFDGAAGNDRLFLGTGDDTGLGGAGNDMIMGDFGNDRLLGGDGDDILTGGRGRDVINGGLGADHFAFNQIDTGDAAFSGLRWGTACRTSTAAKATRSTCP